MSVQTTTLEFPDGAREALPECCVAGLRAQARGPGAGRAQRKLAFFDAPVLRVPFTRAAFAYFRAWCQFHARYAPLSAQARDFRAALLSRDDAPLLLQLVEAADLFQDRALMEFCAPLLARRVDAMGAEELRALFRAPDDPVPAECAEDLRALYESD